MLGRNTCVPTLACPSRHFPSLAPSHRLATWPNLAAAVPNRRAAWRSRCALASLPRRRPLCAAAARCGPRGASLPNTFEGSGNRQERPGLMCAFFQCCFEAGGAASDVESHAAEEWASLARAWRVDGRHAEQPTMSGNSWRPAPPSLRASCFAISAGRRPDLGALSARPHSQAGRTAQLVGALGGALHSCQVVRHDVAGRHGQNPPCLVLRPTMDRWGGGPSGGACTQVLWNRLLAPAVQDLHHKWRVADDGGVGRSNWWPIAEGMRPGATLAAAGTGLRSRRRKSGLALSGRMWRRIVPDGRRVGSPCLLGVALGSAGGVAVGAPGGDVVGSVGAQGAGRARGRR